MASDYSVGNPSMETNISDDGSGFVTSWKVPYKVTDGAAKGTKGHVLVPADQYNAATVHGAIRKAVDAHHSVMSG
jgi:hypothetical protein